MCERERERERELARERERARETLLGNNVHNGLAPAQQAPASIAYIAVVDMFLDHTKSQEERRGDAEALTQPRRWGRGHILCGGGGGGGGKFKRKEEEEEVEEKEKKVGGGALCGSRRWIVHDASGPMEQQRRRSG